MINSSVIRTNMIYNKFLSINSNSLSEEELRNIKKAILSITHFMMKIEY